MKRARAALWPSLAAVGLAACMSGTKQQSVTLSTPIVLDERGAVEHLSTAIRMQTASYDDPKGNHAAELSRLVRAYCGKLSTGASAAYKHHDP